MVFTLLSDANNGIWNFGVLRLMYVIFFKGTFVMNHEDTSKLSQL